MLILQKSDHHKRDSHIPSKVGSVDLVLSSNPLRWSVSDVVKYIKSTECACLASLLREQVSCQQRHCLFCPWNGSLTPTCICHPFIYSRAMKTQHPTVNQYLKDILNILSHGISVDFMNTKGRHHIGFISFNVKSSNVHTHAHFPTVVK